MLVEVRVVYTVPETHHLPGIGDKHVRYACFEVELPEATDEIAPVSIFSERGAAYRNFDGKLYRRRGELITDPGSAPVLYFNPFASALWAIPETPRDAEFCAAERARLLDGAKRWVETKIVRPEGEDVLLLGPTIEPIMVVVPPGDRSDAPWVDPDKPTKVPCLRIAIADTTASHPAYKALLREDRWFALDELDDAVERAAKFGPRVHRGRQFEVRDRSCFMIEPSTLALRLTAGEAIGAVGKLKTPEVTAASLSLSAVVADKDANAATFCPHVRHFLAAFGESEQAHAFSMTPKVAPFLDRLRRAHDRAQIRMAANRIPDRDPRELSRDEDAALGRLGF